MKTRDVLVKNWVQDPNISLGTFTTFLFTWQVFWSSCKTCWWIKTYPGHTSAQNWSGTLLSHENLTVISRWQYSSSGQLTWARKHQRTCPKSVSGGIWCWHVWMGYHHTRWPLSKGMVGFNQRIKIYWRHSKAMVSAPHFFAWTVPLCADALWQTWVKPKETHSDENSLYELVVCWEQMIWNSVPNLVSIVSIMWFVIIYGHQCWTAGWWKHTNRTQHGLH